MIVSSRVDNSAADSDTSYNGYACAVTEDKIFLPSYQDAINADYGYSANYKDYDAARVKFPTDYAKFQGCSYSEVTGNGRYWLRTPYSSLEDHAWHVDRDGILLHSEVAQCFGLAPALNLA